MGGNWALTRSKNLAAVRLKITALHRNLATDTGLSQQKLAFNRSYYLTFNQKVSRDEYKPYWAKPSINTFFLQCWTPFTMHRGAHKLDRAVSNFYVEKPEYWENNFLLKFLKYGQKMTDNFSNYLQISFYISIMWRFRSKFGFRCLLISITISLLHVKNLELLENLILVNKTSY